MTAQDLNYVIDSAVWAIFWLGLGYLLGLLNKRLTRIERHLEHLDPDPDEETRHDNP